jgi:SAM-dependent methyltransferase
MPFEDGSVDVVVLNHIYEHVVDPDSVLREIHRVLSEDGVVYLGLANRLGVVEPHYRLPFLSWLPHGPLADRYVRAFGRADHYYERFRTRRGLRRLVAAFDTWDYTLPVLTDPAGFNGGDVVPGAVARVPTQVLSALLPLVPTYIWVGFRTPRTPAGPPLAIGPRRV